MKQKMTANVCDLCGALHSENDEDAHGLHFTGGGIVAATGSAAKLPKHVYVCTTCARKPITDLGRLAEGGVAA